LSSPSKSDFTFLSKKIQQKNPKNPKNPTIINSNSEEHMPPSADTIPSVCKLVSFDIYNIIDPHGALLHHCVHPIAPNHYDYIASLNEKYIQ
jgi:hypothetical protein